jgi:hypothetical protein
MRNLLKPALALVLASFVLSGCALVLGGTAGALIVDEGINENDGKFDPGENTALGKKIYN